MPRPFALLPILAGAAALLAMLGLRLADAAPLAALRGLFSPMQTPHGREWGPELGLELALALVTGGAVVAYLGRRDAVSARRAVFVALLVIAGTTWSAATRGVGLDPFFPLLSLALTALAAGLGLTLDRHRARGHLRRTFAASLARPHLAALADTQVAEAATREVTLLHAACDTLAPADGNADVNLALVTRILGPLAGRLREAGAYVTTEIDGSLTAIWNAPLDQPAHAALAGRTALGLRPLADSLAISLAGGQTAPAFRVGIGLATGPALAGRLGSTARPTYAVIGDVQAEARRLQRESLGCGMPILMSPATARAAPELASLPLAPGSLVLMGDEAVARAREFRALKPLLAELDANLKINAQSDVAALLDELAKRPWPALWPPLAPFLAHYRARAAAAPRLAHSA